MKFTVKPTFDFSGFLVSCRASGLKLDKTNDNEIPDGRVSLSGSDLTVSIETAGDFQATVQAAVDANNK